MGTITKRTIGKQDLYCWDGATDTFTATTSTSRTQTLDRIDWVGVDVEGVYGAQTLTAINEAITAISTNTCTLFLSPGTWSITDDLTITSNIHLSIPPGAVLSVSAGKTLTINSDIMAGRYQIFSGTGTIYISNMEAPAQWFGAVGDGTGDQSTAIEKALDAVPSGGTVLLYPDRGSHFLTTGPIEMPNNRGLEGPGNPRGGDVHLKYTGVDSAIRGENPHAATAASYGLSVTGLRIEASGVAGKCIDASGWNSSRVIDCALLITGDNGYGIYSSYDDVSYGAYINHFDRLFIDGDEGDGDDNGQTGIYWYGDTTDGEYKANDNVFTTIQIEDVHNGINIGSSKGNYFHQIWIQDTSSVGLYFGDDAKWNMFHSCHIEDCGNAHGTAAGIEFGAGATQNIVEVDDLADCLDTVFNAVGSGNEEKRMVYGVYKDATSVVGRNTRVTGDTYNRRIDLANGAICLSDGTWDPDDTTQGHHLQYFWENGTTRAYPMIQQATATFRLNFSKQSSETTVAEGANYILDSKSLFENGTYIVSAYVTAQISTDDAWRAWHMEGTFHRSTGGNAALVGTITTVHDEADGGGVSSGWAATLDASGVQARLKVDDDGDTVTWGWELQIRGYAVD